MSKSQQEYVAKHLEKKGYLQQIQNLVDQVNLFHTENKKKYPLKLELIHGFSYEEEEDPEYFFTLREKRNWLKSLNWPKRKITIFFHYREDGDWKKRRKPDPDIEKHILRFLTKKEKALQDIALQDALQDELNKQEADIIRMPFEVAVQQELKKLKEKLQKADKEFQASLNKLKEDFQNELENQHVDYPCLVAQIADDFTNLEGFESKYADTDGYLYSPTKALLNGKSIWDWEELDSRFYMNADIDEEEVMDTLKKILMKVTKVDYN